MFGKFLRKISSRHFFGLYVILLLLFTLLGTLLYWQNVKAVEKGEILAAKQKSLLLTRGGASTIVEFLESRKVELLLLAKTPTIANLTDKKGARQELEVFFDSLVEKPLADIIRINKEGKAVLLVGKKRIIAGEGTDISSQDLFVWAKKPENRGKIFIAGMILPQTGGENPEPAFMMATPTYFNDQFTGVLLFSFLPLQLTEKYVLPIRVSEKTQVLLITEGGIVIGGEIKEFLGKNLVDYAKDWLNGENFATILNQSAMGKEGVEDGFFALPGENKPTRKIVAFSTAKIDEAKIIVLSIESEETIKGLFPEFSQNQTFFLSLFTLFALLTGVLWSISSNLVRRDGLLDGMRDGYHKAKVNGLKKV